ncbi:MAG TPA: M20/M25/M40 family metallo-hydrolase [Thermoanaerobaculia bacterium]|nr:M20/M25/M40 family metallo-hydrolase [Thermoanaerobaculia bacterium]
MDPETARKKRRHRRERIAAAVLIAVAVAATFAIRAWSEKTKRELQRDQSYIPKKAVVTPEVRLLQEYVRIDTSTPEGAARGARWLAGVLEKHGIRAELIESAPGRLNVYARIEGEERGGGLLLFNHIDVVPPNGEWSVPPFEGKIAGNTLVGRGTLDMKGLAICQLAAFVDIAKREAPPAHDLVFLATADEETGSEFGMRWLLEHRPDIFEDVESAITEGGVTELLRERMTYFGIEVGGKQTVWLTLGGADRQSMRRLRIALEPHMISRQAGRVLPVVREYFHHTAPTRIAFRPYLLDVDRAIREGQFWRLPMPYRELTQNTIWCSGIFEKDGEWRMNLNLRNLPDEEPGARLAWIERFAAPFGARIVGTPIVEGPSPVSSRDTRLFRILEKEALRRYQAPAGPYLGYRSSSDSRFLRPSGIHAYGVSPHPVDFASSQTIHATNEKIRLDALAEGVDFLKNVVSDWAEAE